MEERRRAVEELRLSDTRFKAIIESTEDILYRQDLVTGDMDYMSPSVEDILGYTVEEMCAMSLSEGEKLFHPADLPMVHEFRHNLVEMEKRGEPHYEMEFRMRRRDGGFEFFRGTYHVMREEPNRVFVVGSLKPISQYKLAEERLKESESRFRLLAENASDVIWTMDQDLRFTYVSQSIERVYGYPRKESLENRLYEIMPPESLNTLMEKFSQIMSGDDGIPNRTSFEITQYRADGSLIWTDVDLVLVKDDEGNLRYLQGLTRDITARKQAENALRESESKFRSLSEAAFEGIVFHRDGRILLANQKYYDLFGYTPKELEGDDALGWTVTPESAVIVQRKIREKTEGPYEVTGLHKSGRTFPLEIQGKSMIGSDSRMRVAAVRDISHRKEAERKLLDYQKQLRSLASELTLAEENERRRVALLLHDGIGQELAFANIQLKMAREDVRDDGPGRILDEVCELIDRTIDEARGLTMELSPPILYEMSIQNALKWLFDQYGKRLRIRGDFEIREPIPAPFGQPQDSAFPDLSGIAGESVQIRPGRNHARTYPDGGSVAGSGAGGRRRGLRPGGIDEVGAEIRGFRSVQHSRAGAAFRWRGFGPGGSGRGRRHYDHDPPGQASGRKLICRFGCCWRTITTCFFWGFVRCWNGNRTSSSWGRRKPAARRWRWPGNTGRTWC